ncbi:hypothetical protein [Kribbella sp. CA-247076]|uniref:hypothetical protein n=1 Tax=Kribbella sp. CA-247076 TaxID=3239941 RepID=UPI003D942AFD
MNIQLEPPSVPPLTAAERARLRNRVMDRTRPAPYIASRPLGRRLAPVAGIAAVAAVVAGTLVITNGPSDDAGVAGQAAPDAKVGIDRGAVPQEDLRKLVSECTFPDEKRPTEVLWSRQVEGITQDSRTLVALARNTSLPAAPPATTPPSRTPGVYPRGRVAGRMSEGLQLGYRFCSVRLPASHELGAIGEVTRIPDAVWQAKPTPQRGLVTLGGNGGHLTANLRTLQASNHYRVLPEVATVEARYVLKDRSGPWTKGVVADGFAYTQVQASGHFTNGQQLRTEVRAFDARGKQIPIG